MPIHFRDVVTKTDWIKIGILVTVAAGCWTWVYLEYQKPIIPPEWIEASLQADTGR